MTAPAGGEKRTPRFALPVSTLAAGAAALVAFLLYLRTLAPGLTEIDSGE